MGYGLLLSGLKITWYKNTSKAIKGQDLPLGLGVT